MSGWRKEARCPLRGVGKGGQPPTGFVDEQVRGPYRLWEHTHSFYDEGDETIIEDVVRFRLPFWPFGEIAHPMVRLQLGRIFRYRQSAVRRSLLH